MRVRDTTLPILLLAAAGIFLLPERGESFEVFGDTLDLTQRDFRVWNNFQDATANDNQTPDPDFPGSTGATLAIRKAVAEWGSRPHGSGTTDPSQDLLGSGGSNFDAFFSGETALAGGTNGNIFSPILAPGAIHAFTELPIGDGWRIRFFDDPYDWNDGPGVPSGGLEPYDIQGVATHEYGHALGLDHTPVLDATMFASPPATGVILRSLEPDDIAGVQFLYGVASAFKPRIDGYALAGGSVTLSGEFFHPTDNEVWFTQAAPATMDILKVLNVVSSNNGTELTVAVPANAVAGDIVIARPAGTFDDLSNVFPFDPDAEYDFRPPFAYGSGKTTSFNSVPSLRALSLPSATAGSFQVEVTGGTQTGPAVLFKGDARQALPFFGGHLYVGGPLRRMATFSFLGGAALVDVNVPPALVGRTQYFQVWFSDPGDSQGVGLTNGLSVTYVP